MAKLYTLADLPTLDEARHHGFSDRLTTKHPKRCLKGMLTGEFRAPKAGEWFLSGAIPEGYRATNDLSGEYYILKLVVACKQVTWEIEESTV
jgi:hypothetical protein